MTMLLSHMSISSIEGQFVDYLQGKRCSWALSMRIETLGSSISLSMVVERKSSTQGEKLRIRGDEFTGYAIPNDTIVDVLSSLQIRFGQVMKC